MGHGKLDTTESTAQWGLTGSLPQLTVWPMQVYKRESQHRELFEQWCRLPACSFSRTCCEPQTSAPDSALSPAQLLVSCLQVGTWPWLPGILTQLDPDYTTFFLFATVCLTLTSWYLDLAQPWLHYSSPDHNLVTDQCTQDSHLSILCYCPFVCSPSFGRLLVCIMNQHRGIH